MTVQLPKLPPGADIVFRRLFNEEDDCHLLIGLLNGVLRYPPGQRIISLTLERTQLPGPLADDKEVVLDVRAVAEDGRRFHIEVQLTFKPAYAARMLYYWTGIYQGQLEAGQGYTDLRAVVSVHFLFFPLLRDAKHAAYHHIFRARADGDGAILSPHFELHTIEMTKFPDVVDGDAEPKWVFYLKHGHQMTTEEVEQLGVPEIVEADRKLAMISQDRALRVEYERRKMAHHDAVSLTRDARREGLDEGLEKGKLLGLDEGLEKGKLLGLDEGKRLAIRALCEVLDIELTAPRQSRLEELNTAQLEALLAHLKAERAWPPA